MQSLGMNPYIPLQFASETRDIPHIFSRDELVGFFDVVDDYTPPQSSLRRLSLSYRVLFRLFYCCGVRLAEACYLRRRCVDLKKGILRILQSKGDKDRLVYLSDDVRVMCRDYDAWMQPIIPDRELISDN
jgi:integrase